ncbi:MAG: NADPH:quinone oxidoreductase family protein [Rhodospirillales bacterium]|nr:MAG: NADPH:quinone oxidoreductase family protein [Rhodospirillales bacterium]
MRAIRVDEFGGPEAAKLAELEPPRPGPDEVRIRVHAAGVNFADTLMVRGRYQATPPPPFTPGMEVAGEIVDAGANIKWFKPGDRAIAVLDHGGFAEEILAHHSRIMQMPVGMSFEAAAASPIVYGTSHVALTHRTRLAPGETLLVHGAAGGAGLAAVELGKVLGAKVIAVASTPEKRRVVTDYGAGHVLDPNNEVIHERVLELTGNKGADVIYDPVGGDAFNASLRCAAFEARIIIVGFAGGKIQRIPANILLVKNISAIGYYWGAYATHRLEVLRESFTQLKGMYEAGQLKPLVGATFPLEQAAAALAHLSDRKAVGKTIITMGR